MAQVGAPTLSPMRTRMVTPSAPCPETAFASTSSPWALPLLPPPLRDPLRLRDDRVLQLLRLHPLHDLPAAEEQPHALMAVRHAHVGGGGPARAVHFAAHHRHGPLALHAGEPLLHPLGDGDHLDRAAAAG